LDDISNTLELLHSRQKRRKVSRKEKTSQVKQVGP